MTDIKFELGRKYVLASWGRKNIIGTYCGTFSSSRYNKAPLFMLESSSSALGWARSNMGKANILLPHDKYSRFLYEDKIGISVVGAVDERPKIVRDSLRQDLLED